MRVEPWQRVHLGRRRATVPAWAAIVTTITTHSFTSKKASAHCPATRSASRTTSRSSPRTRSPAGMSFTGPSWGSKGVCSDAAGGAKGLAAFAFGGSRRVVFVEGATFTLDPTTRRRRFWATLLTAANQHRPVHGRRVGSHPPLPV